MNAPSLKSLVVFGCLVAAMLAWLPDSAFACAVCGAAQEEATRKAFVGTTAFMTFLPLGMLAVLIGWFIRRSLEIEQEEEVTTPPEHEQIVQPLR